MKSRKSYHPEMCRGMAYPPSSSAHFPRSLSPGPFHIRNSTRRIDAVIYGEQTCYSNFACLILCVRRVRVRHHCVTMRHSADRHSQSTSQICYGILDGNRCIIIIIMANMEYICGNGMSFISKFSPTHLGDGQADGM